MNRHIALVGLMGVGKTTVGELVAAQLQRPFHDSDHDLALRLGMAAKVFAERNGLAALHQQEAEVLLAALASDAPLVVSAAASTVEDARCRAALQDAFVVWLHAEPSVLELRAETGAHRPLRADVASQLAEQSQRRAPLFQALAGMTFDVALIEADAIADQVVRRLRDP